VVATDNRVFAAYDLGGREGMPELPEDDSGRNSGLQVAKCELGMIDDRLP
jgi:hypothetical protein